MGRSNRPTADWQCAFTLTKIRGATYPKPNSKRLARPMIASRIRKSARPMIAMERLPSKMAAAVARRILAGFQIYSRIYLASLPVVVAGVSAGQHAVLICVMISKSALKKPSTARRPTSPLKSPRRANRVVDRALRLARDQSSAALAAGTAKCARNKASSSSNGHAVPARDAVRSCLTPATHVAGRVARISARRLQSLFPQALMMAHEFV